MPAQVTALHLHHFSLCSREAAQLAALTRLQTLELDGVVFETCGAIAKLTSLQVCALTSVPHAHPSVCTRLAARCAWLS